MTHPPRGRRPTLRASLLATALGLAAPLATAQLPEPASGRVMFGDAAFLPGVSTAVLAADLNADGFDDLVTGTFELSVGLNNGSAVFARVSNTEVDDPHFRRFLAADFDGDGHQDVIAASDANGGRVWVFRGDGTGQLSLASEVGVPAAGDLAVADLDLDGVLDLVVGHDAAGVDFHVLRGTGKGELAAPTAFGTSGSGRHVAAGDWNLDGAPDVFSSGGPQIQYWVNDGTGQLSAQFADFDQQDIDGPLVFTDLEADGSPELLHRRRGPTDALVVQRNDAGGFGGSTAYSLGAGSADVDAIAVERAPGDGLRDVAFAGGNRIVVLDDDTTGLHQVATLEAAFSVSISQALSVGDIDGDGNMDVVHATGKGCRVRFRQSFDSFGEDAIAELADGPGGLNWPNRIVSAQLDGDPEPEFLIADNGAPLVHIAEADDDLLLHVIDSLPTFNSSANFLELADVVEGAGPDLVLGHDGPTAVGYVAVHPRAGVGGFGAPIVTEVGGRLVGIADVNGDGHLDATSRSGSLSFGFALSTWLGAGDGSFTPGPVSPLAPGLSGACLGDMNADGTPDAVLVHQIPGTPVTYQVAVRLGDGAGGYGPPLFAPDPLNAVNTPALGDFDGNGTLDVVTPTHGDCGRVALFLNDGSGQLGAGTRSGFDTITPYGLLVADIDQDGRLDVAHPTSSDEMLVVLRGNGSGGFEAPTAHRGVRSTFAGTLLSVDVDLDGKRDLVQLSDVSSSQQALVLRRLGSPLEAWASVGGGVPGAAGQPRAKGGGFPKTGKLLTLKVTRAPPLNLAYMVTGVQSLGLPFKGGHLVPAPDWIFFLPTTNAAGELNLEYAWTLGLPAHFDAWMQVWFPDPSAVRGYSATGGQRLRVP